MKEKDLIKRVINWAYKGTGYNGQMPEEQLNTLAWQFECHDWDRECNDWGNRAMALDPIAYQPTEGIVWESQVNIFKAAILRRIGERAGDTEPFLGRTAQLVKLYEMVSNYKASESL